MKGLLITVICSCVTTICFGQSDIKWEEIFDTPEPPAGWQVFNRDGSPPSGGNPGVLSYQEQIVLEDDDGEVLATIDPQAGSNFWFSNFENANASGLIDEWLISPRIEGIENGDELAFYAGAPANEFDDSLRVFVSTTDSLLQSFTNQIAQFKVDGPVETYNRYTFDLSAFAGQDIFVAVNYYIVDGGPSGQHSDALWLDHFVVSRMATDVADGAVPMRFSLAQNYPNPFNPTTKIDFTLARASRVLLRVFNLLGQEVATPVEDKLMRAGSHSITFDAKRLPNGIYYYRIEAGEFTDFRKMTVLK